MEALITTPTFFFLFMTVVNLYACIWIYQELEMRVDETNRSISVTRIC